MSGILSEAILAAMTALPGCVKLSPRGIRICRDTTASRWYRETTVNSVGWQSEFR